MTGREIFANSFNFVNDATIGNKIVGKSGRSVSLVSTEGVVSIQRFCPICFVSWNNVTEVIFTVQLLEILSKIF